MWAQRVAAGNEGGGDLLCRSRSPGRPRPGAVVLVELGRCLPREMRSPSGFRTRAAVSRVSMASNNDVGGAGAAGQPVGDRCRGRVRVLTTIRRSEAALPD